MLAVRKQLLIPEPFPFSMEKCGLYLPLWQENMQGSTIISHDPNHHSCTVTGSLWKPYGRLCDGDDYIDCGAKVVGPGAVSLIAWVRIAPNAAYYTILDNVGGSSANTGITLGIVDDGTIYTYHADGLENINTIGSGVGVVDDSAWHIVGVSWDGTTAANAVKIFIDDAEDHTATATRAWTAAATLDLHAWVLAKAVPDTNFLTGDVGDMWGFNEAISLAEFKHLREVTIWRYQ